MLKYNIQQAFILGLLITTSVLVAAQGPVENNQAERIAKVNQLLEVASAPIPSSPIPEEILKETDIAKRNQYNEERRRLVSEEREKREQARNEIAALGDDIIDPLYEKYNESVRYELSAIYVLKKIGTQKAKDTLLNIAMGQNRRKTPDSLAAQTYVAITKDKNEIKQLLSSKNPDILSIALQGIKEIKVDAELLKRLDEILQSVQYHPVLNCTLRTNAAEVIVADTGSELLQEKVSSIVKSIQTVDNQPKANERYESTIIGTFADRTYLDLAQALIKIKASDKYLSEATSSMTGIPRGWMLAIRANRGDSSVKSELRKVLDDPTSLERTLLRSFILSGYAKIGTAEDIPFLSNIAENDPMSILEMRDATGPVLETINGKPINNTGERAVPYDEDEYVKKLWESPRGRYIIRSQAESAIKSIEARIKSDSSRLLEPNN
jgi:hypothetical protein